MNTRSIATEYRLTHWAGIMNERRESGLSIKAFCENARIHENTYFYWQKRLREAACGEMQGTAMMPSGFMEVRLTNQQMQSHSAENNQSQVSIELSGIRITVGCEYPADKLAVLLREVGG